MTNLLKITGTILFALLAEAFNEILPLAIIAFAFVITDCISAWRLSRRVHKSGCNNGKKGSCGKFKSAKMAATVFHLILIIPTGLLLAFFTQKYVIEHDINLPQIYCGVIIFWQLWSILENESSCSDAQWAKLLQKILIDKTERHFDVDLSELKNSETSNTQ